MAKRKKAIKQKCMVHKLKMVEGGLTHNVFACTNKGCTYKVKLKSKSI